MTYELQNIQRLRVTEELAFASDGTGTLANFTDVPFREGTLTAVVTTDEVNPQTNQQRRFGRAKDVLGKRSATLTFTMNLSSFGAQVTSASDSALHRILKALMGGARAGDASTVATPITARRFTLASATGFNIGGGAGWINAAGDLETGEVSAKTSNTITIKRGFSTAPTTGNTIYASSTYYFTEDPQTTLQFLVEGAESDDRWLLLGGVGSFTLNLDPAAGDCPTITFNLQFCDYKESDETAGTVTGTLGTATFTGHGPFVAYEGEFRLHVSSATAYATSQSIPIASESYAPQFGYTPITSPSGTNTVARWRGGRGSVAGSFLSFFQALTYSQARDARTDYTLWRQLGRAVGYTVVLSAPTIQIKNPQRVPAGEMAGQSVEWAARNDEVITASTTAQAISAFRLHKW